MTEPPVTIRAKFSSFSAGDNMTPNRVVIHATCPNVGYPTASAPGSAASTARYFAGGSAGGSAHYVVDGGDEQHCVPDNTVAFHAPPNARSIGIEICSEGGTYPLSYTREQWLSPQVWPAVLKAAARTAELCTRFSIPTVKINSTDLLAGAHGVCGHVDVSQAWHQSTHSDPGPQFPWPEFMAAVNGASSGIGTATSLSQDEPMSVVQIRVNADGTFAETICVEAGASSLVVARAFVTWGTAWGDTHFKVTMLGANGLGMGPATQKEATLVNNHRDFLEVPNGAVLCTIEGKVIDPKAATRPAAALVCKYL